MNKKITKKDFYTAIKKIVTEAKTEEVEMITDITVEEIVEFVDKMVEQIDAKAKRAKEKAEEKKTEGDQLRASVQAVLTDEFQTIDAIVAQIEDEEVTKSKVTARLTQLVAAEIAVKEQIKVDGRKVMTYALKAEAEAEVVEVEAETADENNEVD